MRPNQGQVGGRWGTLSRCPTVQALFVVADWHAPPVIASPFPLDKLLSYRSCPSLRPPLTLPARRAARSLRQRPALGLRREPDDDHADDVDAGQQREDLPVG